MKEFQLPSTNIILTRGGYDTNGNWSLFGYVLPNLRFKIQINNPDLNRTQRELRGDKTPKQIERTFSMLSEREQIAITQEIYNHLRNWGSKRVAAKVKSWLSESRRGRYNRF